jgi:hypothetical protein
MQIFSRKVLQMGFCSISVGALSQNRGRNMNQHYTGSIEQDCAAVMRSPAPKADLDSKIKAAIGYAVDDNLIYATSRHDYAFTIDGERQFYDLLASYCTATEKADLLHDWILTGDQVRAVEVVDYLMADFNPVKSIARDSATRIINHCLFSQCVTEALAARGLPF